MKAVLIKVLGDVQGVSYRYWTKKEATSLEILGWTKNEADGSVAIFAQGEDGQIGKLIEWAKEGSPMSTVEKVEVEDAELDLSIRGFEVK